MSYKDLMGSPGPKKLLALDGGGIRGVITLEVLLRLESMPAEELGAGDDFVLGDYFDYIGGTRTGAVIAAGLAKGLRVTQVLDLYVARCEEMFDHASLRRRYHYRYGSLRLKELLQSVLGKETTLGSEDLKTLLLIVVRNASTDSPWPLSNNPNALFNDTSSAARILLDQPLPQCNCLPVVQARMTQEDARHGITGPKAARLSVAATIACVLTNARYPY
ncbi:MAG: patatin-like phospholipase family protein [Mycobacterium sp.]